MSPAHSPSHRPFLERGTITDFLRHFLTKNVYEYIQDLGNERRRGSKEVCEGGKDKVREVCFICAKNLGKKNNKI